MYQVDGVTIDVGKLREDIAAARAAGRTYVQIDIVEKTDTSVKVFRQDGRTESYNSPVKEVSVCGVFPECIAPQTCEKLGCCQYFGKHDGNV
jgi:hypothetical protein